MPRKKKKNLRNHRRNGENENIIAQGKIPVARHYSPDNKMLSIKDKLLLGLSLSEYLAQAFRNPLNWIFAIIFTFGGYVTITRFLFGLGYVTHSSYDYPWGLFLGWGLVCNGPPLGFRVHAGDNG